MEIWVTAGTCTTGVHQRRSAGQGSSRPTRGSRGEGTGGEPEERGVESCPNNDAVKRSRKSQGIRIRRAETRKGPRPQDHPDAKLPAEPGRGRQIQGAEWKEKAAPPAPSDIPPSDPRNNQASSHTMLRRRHNPGCKAQHKHKLPKHETRTRRQNAQNPRSASRRAPFANESTHTPPRRSR